MFKKLNKKGFTLAELLVVVAIIGVLVAISIPIFTNQLEKSREAVDLANVRSAYAEVQTAALTDTTQTDLTKQSTTDIVLTTTGAESTKDRTYKAVVTLKQKVDEWQTTGTPMTAVGGVTATGTVKAGGHATIEYKEADGKTSIVYGD